MAKKLFYCATYGKENPEKATLPFLLANNAVNADLDTTVFLTIEGVWLATKGYADSIHKEGFPPLNEVIKAFLESGGKVWACGACTKPRSITPEKLVDGARIVTADMVNEQLASGVSTLTI